MDIDAVSGDAPLALTALGVDPASPLVFAGRPSGLYLSRHGASDWTTVDLADAGTTTVAALAAIRPGDGDPIILAGVNGGIVRFRYPALQAEAIPFTSPPPLVTCIAGWNPWIQEDRLLAGTLEDGVYWSDDAGLTWAPGNTGLLDMSVSALCCAWVPDRTYLALAGTETNVFTSVNGGRSWRDAGFGALDVPVQAVAWSASCGTIIIGTDGAGLFRSRFGTGQWEPIGTGLPVGHVSALHCPGDDAEGSIIIAVADSGIAVSLDGGSAWRFQEVDLAANDHIVASCLHGRTGSNASLVVGMASGDVRIVPIEHPAPG